MDPFSITVNTLTLVYLAINLRELGTAYCQSSNRQHTEVQRLVREIGFLSGILNTISTTLKSEDGRANLGILQGPLEECKTDLLELHEFLLKQMGGRNKFMGMRRKLKWPLREQETKGWIERIERLKRTFLLGLEVHKMGTQGKIRSEVAALKLSQEEMRREELLDRQRQKYLDALAWLSPTDHLDNQLCARRLQHPGTGRWLLDHNTYCQWEVNDQSFLWIYGEEGTGKTILSSMIIDHLTQTPSSSHLFYFYCSAQHLKPAALYGSLIRQTLESSFPELPDFIEKYFDASRIRQPYQHEVKDIFQKLLLGTPGSTTIIIDGLRDSTETEELLICFAELHQTCDIKLLITSRDEPKTISVPGLLELQIQPALVAHDVSLFIVQEMERQPILRRLKPELKAEVIDAITTEAGGVFWSAKRSLETVSRMRTDRDIRNALRSLELDSPRAWNMPEGGELCLAALP